MLSAKTNVPRFRYPVTLFGVNHDRQYHLRPFVYQRVRFNALLFQSIKTKEKKRYKKQKRFWIDRRSTCALFVTKTVSVDEEHGFRWSSGPEMGSGKLRVGKGGAGDGEGFRDSRDRPLNFPSNLDGTRFERHRVDVQRFAKMVLGLRRSAESRWHNPARKIEYR